MNRRAFLFAGLAASTALSTARASSSIEVIYVGGIDCSYCTLWKKQYKADWVASPEYRQVSYVEIDPPHLREAYQERYWPGELRELLEQIPRKSGTPRFLIVKDGRIVSNELGIYKWKNSLAYLRHLLD